MQHFSFSIATHQEAEQIAVLVNSSYRGETSKLGWTYEADLLDGRRTDADDIHDLLEDVDSLILLCSNSTEIIASIHLQKKRNEVYMGMLAVKPSQQKTGLGKQLLLTAEILAQETWGITDFAMVVITCRHELIAFYERRGYRRTGILIDFPSNPLLWTAKVTGLQLEILEKSISKTV